MKKFLGLEALTTPSLVFANVWNANSESDWEAQPFRLRLVVKPSRRRAHAWEVIADFLLSL
jgi:hypothetical protein